MRGERGNGGRRRLQTATRLHFFPATEGPRRQHRRHEGAPCVPPVGDFLYFASNRPGGHGRFDLYRCRLKDDGTLSAPENLGKQVNTAANETDPQLAVGGFHLYFSSDRDGPRPTARRTSTHPPAATTC